MFGDTLIADFYKFDLRRTDGTLLWREDCHEGHEREHGSPCHLYIGPSENHRVPVPPATLESIAHGVVDTHISIGQLSDDCTDDDHGSMRQACPCSLWGSVLGHQAGEGPIVRPADGGRCD